MNKIAAMALIATAAMGSPGSHAELIEPRRRRTSERGAIALANRRPKISKAERRMARADARRERLGRKGFRPSWMQPRKVTP